jgi:hypothetical protein
LSAQFIITQLSCAHISGISRLKDLLAEKGDDRVVELEEEVASYVTLHFSQSVAYIVSR